MFSIGFVQIARVALERKELEYQDGQGSTQLSRPLNLQGKKMMHNGNFSVFVMSCMFFVLKHRLNNFPNCRVEFQFADFVQQTRFHRL